MKNISGVGLSARPQHFSSLLETKEIPWLEILADNFFYPSSPSFEKLEKLCEMYPLVFHCVKFNLGSVDTLDKHYLKKIKKLVKKFNPSWISDHLCFCGVKGLGSPDLLPIPYNKKILLHIGEKIKRIIDFLEIPFLIENVSTYIKPHDSFYSEEEFLKELLSLSDGYLLLDINNLYVNSINHGFDPLEAFSNLPSDRIRQIHLAGHTPYETHIIDTHAEDIQDEVLNLFETIGKQLDPIPVCIERDGNIPSFIQMKREVSKVCRIYEAIHG